MALPTGISSNDFEVLDAGTYEATLTSIKLVVGTEYQSPLRFQQCELTWDVDGDELRDNFIRVSLNERSKLYNRLKAVKGADLAEADVVNWELNEHAQTDCVLDVYHRETDEAGEVDFVKDGEELTGTYGLVDALTINKENMIGRTAMLEVSINANGYNKVVNAMPMPKASKRPKGMPS